MPVDPFSKAASLLADPQDISPVERQNRYGIRHACIAGLPSNRCLTVLAIQTRSAFGKEQFFDVLNWLSENHDVETIQTAFSAEIPDFGESYRNDLYLTAHLRAEESVDGKPEPPLDASSET